VVDAVPLRIAVEHDAECPDHVKDGVERRGAVFGEVGKGVGPVAVIEVIKPG